MATTTPLRLTSTPVRGIEPHSYAKLPQQTCQRDYQLLKSCPESSISYDKILLLIAQGADPLYLRDNQSALKIACDLVAQDNGQNEVNVRILKLFLSKIPVLQPSSASASPHYNEILLLMTQGADFLYLKNNQSALKIACDLVAQDNGQNKINVQILKIFLSKISTPPYVGFLPSEVWDHILDFLPRDREFIDLALVSKYFQGLVEQRLQSDWNSAIQTLPALAMQAKKIGEENPRVRTVVKLGIFAKQLFPKSKVTTASLKELVSNISLASLYNKIWQEYERLQPQLLPRFESISNLRAWLKTEEAKLILASIILEITIYDEDLYILSPEIGLLENLLLLDVRDTQLRDLPQEISNLKSLAWLHAPVNQLVTLPQEIGNLEALQGLYLPDNQIQTLPQQIGNLRNLREIDLSDNKLQVLPEELSNLGSLTCLQLPNNMLQKLPQQICNLENLQWLDLSDNKLQTLPQQIFKLKNLRVLDLSGNQLQELPQQIGNLENLQWLCLSDNRLQTLPQQIGNLGNLRRLVISGNQLRELPQQIGNLENLQELVLDTVQQSLFQNPKRFLPKCQVTVNSMQHKHQRLKHFNDKRAPIILSRLTREFTNRDPTATGR